MVNEYFKILKFKIKSGDVSNKDLDMYFMTDKWLKIRKEMLKAQKEEELSKKSHQITPFIDENTDLNIIDLTDIDNSNKNNSNLDDIDTNLVLDESLYNQLMMKFLKMQILG